MRDVATDFYVDVLNRLIAARAVSISDSVLVVCGGPLDDKVMRQVGFEAVTITNLDNGMANHRQDAENLTYDDGSLMSSWSTPACITAIRHIEHCLRCIALRESASSPSNPGTVL